MWNEVIPNFENLNISTCLFMQHFVRYIGTNHIIMITLIVNANHVNKEFEDFSYICYMQLIP